MSKSTAGEEQIDTPAGLGFMRLNACDEIIYSAAFSSKN